MDRGEILPATLVEEGMTQMTKINIDLRTQKSYEDLSGRRWILAELTAKERQLVWSVLKRAKQSTAWPELSSSWRRALLKVHPHLSGKDLVRLPVYAICQDIASRVGIEQGYFRQHDYRDDLTDLIARTLGSRYRFAKRVGLDEAFLSRVLSKRAHFSIDKLEQAVASLGYRVALVPTGEGRSTTSTAREVTGSRDPVNG